MGKLPGISQKKAVRAFERAGFMVVRQSGHIIMVRGTQTLVIPRHDPVNAYTMYAIVMSSGLSVEEFRKLL